MDYYKTRTSGGTVVIELKRNADHVITLLFQHRRNHRRIDATRHRRDNAALFRCAIEPQAIEAYGRIFSFLQHFHCLGLTAKTKALTASYRNTSASDEELGRHRPLFTRRLPGL